MNARELNKPEQNAHEYALRTTSTRCASIGGCDKCRVRNCDYRSRRDAYLQAVDDTLDSLALIPWDEAMTTIINHIKKT